MSKAILEEAISCLDTELPRLAEITVRRVCLGWGYTAVELSTGDVGLCHSLLGDPSFTCCERVPNSGMLAGSRATQLTELAKSWNAAEKVVGVAAINALSQIVLKRPHEEYTIAEGNVLDHLYLRPTDVVAMVGNIKPLVPAISSKTSRLQIFERGGVIDENVLPDTACEELIPEADVVLITGSALANGTLERLLQLSCNARGVGVVGPSASIVPDPLFKRGVGIVGGAIVEDSDRVMQIVAEGGGTPQLKAAIRFVVVKPKRTGSDVAVPLMSKSSSEKSE